MECKCSYRLHLTSFKASHPLIPAELLALLCAGALFEPVHDAFLLQDLQLVHAHQHLRWTHITHNQHENLRFGSLQKQRSLTLTKAAQ